VNLDALATDLLARAEGRARFVMAIAGAPGAGKSTFSDALLAALERAAPGRAALVPMDGYHLDNAVLADRGLLARKGSPQTFDVAGMARDLARIRAGEPEVLAPVFDRDLDLARACARVVGPEHAVVLVEGNYLLLDAAPWDGLAAYFDRTLFIEVPVEELRRRLIDRWLGYGLGQEGAWLRAESNDLPNAMLVAGGSRGADLVWRDGHARPGPAASG
jgi:pantothenate kinase